MKKLTDSYILNNGVAIPCVGFGTWQTPDGETAVNSVKAALAAGYRHIDTAAIYGNEVSVGKAIAEMFISEGHEVTGIDLKESSIESERYRHIVCDIRNIDDLPIRSILNIGLPPLNDCVINDPELWAQIMEQTPLKK